MHRGVQTIVGSFEPNDQQNWSYGGKWTFKVHDGYRASSGDYVAVLQPGWCRQAVENEAVFNIYGGEGWRPRDIGDEMEVADWASGLFEFVWEV
jgi:hypothetical protein